MLKKRCRDSEGKYSIFAVRGELKTKYELFKIAVIKDPNIKSVCLSSHLPCGIWSNGGGYKWQGKPPEVDPLVSNTTVDLIMLPYIRN